MQYEQVWNAVDKLASSQGLSPSGLAKKAGLDATTFNKSKRIRPDGKKRWPSLDSINKILEVSGITFEQFYNLAEGESAVKFTQLNKQPRIQNKELHTGTWNKIRFPDSKDKLYAIDLDNEDFAPLYRYGTLVIASKNSEIRRGDRIIIVDINGQLDIKEFIRRTASSLEVVDINSGLEASVNLSDIKLVNRIVWASQ